MIFLNGFPIKKVNLQNFFFFFELEICFGGRENFCQNLVPLSKVDFGKSSFFYWNFLKIFKYFFGHFILTKKNYI